MYLIHSDNLQNNHGYLLVHSIQKDINKQNENKYLVFDNSFVNINIICHAKLIIGKIPCFLYFFTTEYMFKQITTEDKKKYTAQSWLNKHNYSFFYKQNEYSFFHKNGSKNPDGLRKNDWVEYYKYSFFGKEESSFKLFEQAERYSAFVLLNEPCIIYSI